MVASPHDGGTWNIGSEGLDRLLDCLFDRTRVVDPTVSAPGATVTLCFRGGDSEIEEFRQGRGCVEKETLCMRSAFECARQIIGTYNGRIDISLFYFHRYADPGDHVLLPRLGINKLFLLRRID